MDDVRAIMDDIGSQRAVLLGLSEGSAMSATGLPPRIPSVYPSSFFMAALLAVLIFGVQMFRWKSVAAYEALGQRRLDQSCDPKPGREPGRRQSVRQI